MGEFATTVGTHGVGELVMVAVAWGMISVGAPVAVARGNDAIAVTVPASSSTDKPELDL